MRSILLILSLICVNSFAGTTSVGLNQNLIYEPAIVGNHLRSGVNFIILTGDSAKAMYKSRSSKAENEYKVVGGFYCVDRKNMSSETSIKLSEYMTYSSWAYSQLDFLFDTAAVSRDYRNSEFFCILTISQGGLPIHP